jgi:bifunctional UDP-N-acetylglucosamine pyrophosphorylase/glucosamine-1-phosphate N-acetyltransferase
MNLSVIILAAGEGKRMQSSIPKVMHKIANKPMIGHVLSHIKPLHLNDVVIVVGPNMEPLEKYTRLELGSARCVVQSDRRGTADAVKIGLKNINNPNNDILVLYGDHPLITTATIEKLHKVLNEDVKTALVLISFIPADAAEYGRIVVSKEGKLERIVEYSECSEREKGINLSNSGIMVVKGGVMHKLLPKIKNNNAKGEYYLTDLVALANEEGLKCKHVTIDESEVMGVNTRSDLTAAEKVVQHHLRQKMLAAGVTLMDPDTVYFSSDTIIERDVILHPYVVFGNGVEVKSGTEIRSFCHLEGAIIGHNVKVGPFARIRPGTEIEENSSIGNFVEIKNSKIASATKINHLSYIGDASIGKEVNIGAGTITCNYDGVSKHHTEIGEGVFVGSNSALIAPVKIGAKAMIAAGSIINKDVEEDSLAISRVEQKNIYGKASTIRKIKKSKIPTFDVKI